MFEVDHRHSSSHPHPLLPWPHKQGQNISIRWSQIKEHTNRHKWVCFWLAQTDCLWMERWNNIHPKWLWHMNVSPTLIYSEEVKYDICPSDVHLLKRLGVEFKICRKEATIFFPVLLIYAHRNADDSNCSAYFIY